MNHAYGSFKRGQDSDPKPAPAPLGSAITVRPGTCIIDNLIPTPPRASCGHGYAWDEGAKYGLGEGFACRPCIEGTCNHRKAPGLPLLGSNVLAVDRRKPDLGSISYHCATCGSTNVACEHIQAKMDNPSPSTIQVDYTLEVEKSSGLVDPCSCYSGMGPVHERGAYGCEASLPEPGVCGWPSCPTCGDEAKKPGGNRSAPIGGWKAKPGDMWSPLGTTDLFMWSGEEWVKTNWPEPKDDDTSNQEWLAEQEELNEVLEPVSTHHLSEDEWMEGLHKAYLRYVAKSDQEPDDDHPVGRVFDQKTVNEIYSAGYALGFRHASEP